MSVSHPIPDDYYDLTPCACDERWDLPMLMDDGHGESWIECDFCGNATRFLKSDEDAVFQWNLFAHRRGERMSQNKLIG